MAVTASSRKLALQLTFNVIMLLLGASLSIRGTAMADLAEKYNSDVAIMGMGLLPAGIGSFVSCVSVGFVMDWAHSKQHLVMSAYMAIAAVTSLLMPYGQFPWVFWALNFLFGSSSSSYGTTTYSFSLQMWRNSQWGSGPFLHSLILFYIMGFFVTPLICAPLLSNTLVEDHQLSQQLVKKSQVDLVFIALAALNILISLAVCFLGKGLGNDSSIEDSNENNENDDKAGHIDVRENEESQMSPGYKWKRIILVGIMSNFYFVDYTLLMGICNFLISAVIHSNLKLDKVDGAFLISIFFLGQIIIAALNSILSRWLSPNQVLAISLSLVAASSALMLFSWDHNHLLIQISFFALGLGTGSMLATTMVWLDQFIPVGTKSVGIMQAFSGFGLIASGIIFAPNVETFPLILPLASLGLLICCLIIFGIGGLLGVHLREQREIQRASNKL